MTEHILAAVIMMISLIAGTSAALSRSTGTKTWTSVGYYASFVFAFASMMIPYSNEESYLFVRGLAFASLAVAGLAYTFAMTEMTGVLIPKPLKFTAGVVTIVYVLLAVTMNAHGLFISNVKIPDIADFSVTYTYGIVYYISGLAITANATVLGIYAVIGMSRKLVKVSVGAMLLAIFSLITLVATSVCYIFFDISYIMLVAVVIADLLMVVMLKADRADILEFGKSCSVDSTNDGVIILDNKKNFLFANKTAKSVFLELSESDRGKITEFVSTVTESDSIKRGDRVFALKKNSYIDYRGDCDCIVVMIHDVTEQSLRTDRLTEEAAVDTISGLSSRAKTLETLAEACEELSGTLLVINFDGFKAVNNLHGHEEANKLLASIGTIVKNNTNSDDVRGRLGGELFTVFLKDCTNEGVIANLTMRLEEQVNEAVRKQLGNSSGVSMGVSVGGVVVPGCGRDIDKLIELASTELNKIQGSGGHGYSLNAGSNSSNSSGELLTEIIPDLPSETDDEKPSEETKKSTDDSDDSEFKEIIM